MKIAHVGPSGLSIRHDLGGAVERRIRELARGQVSAGHRVVVYSPESEPGTATENDVVYESVVCKRRGRWRTMEYCLKTARRVRRDGPDVVHVHGLPEFAALCGGAGRIKVLTYDFFRFRRGRETPLYRLYRLFLQKFTALLPVSEFCRLESLRYWDLTGARVQVMNNGVNLKQFCPDPESGLRVKTRLGLESQRVLLYLGRVCSQKGTDILVEAYRSFRRNRPDWALVVAGPPERFGHEGNTPLTEAIRSCGGLYLGPLRDEDLAGVLNACDVFVMPTREDEIFGMAAVEAQACGKPVICSRLGGLPEVVSKESGLFFEPGRSEELAEAMDALAVDTDLRRKMGESARASSERFGWELIAKRSLEIYEDLLGH